MTHREFLYALQLLGEERYGSPERARRRAEVKQATRNTQALERAHARSGR